MTNETQDTQSGFAVIAAGPHASSVAKSFYDFGLDNVLLIGDSEIDVIDIPPERKFVSEVGQEKTMQAAEKWAATNIPAIFQKMKEKLGKPSRVIIVVAADSFWAGTCLVLAECAMALLKHAGHVSAQRVGMIVAVPPAVELQKSQAAKDVKFLIDRLVDCSMRQRMFDPLIIGDRTNICGMLDDIVAPSQELNDVIDDKLETADIAIKKTQTVVRTPDDLYGE